MHEQCPGLAHAGSGGGGERKRWMCDKLESDCIPILRR